MFGKVLFVTQVTDGLKKKTDYIKFVNTAKSVQGI